jgi:hypothetical protein
VDVNDVLKVLYDNFKVEKTINEEKLMTEGLSIGHVEDSVEDGI